MQKVLFLLAAALCCAGRAGAAQDNLASNPGFEQPPSTNGLPGGGWWLYQGLGKTEVSVDHRLAHGGDAAVRLASTEHAKSVLVSAPFSVAPGDELQFSVWARGENVASNQPSAYAGLAFRHADGRVLGRAYFRSEPLNSQWQLMSGAAKAPVGAARAEVHLGYSNAPAAVWFDDVAVVITNPVSFSLIAGARPWPGEQVVTVRVINRQATSFQGRIAACLGSQTNLVPVLLDPGASRNVEVPLTLPGIGVYSYKLSLTDATGASVRVLQGKFRTAPPLALYPPCPCYHLAGQGDGRTRLDARLNLPPTKRAGTRLRVELVDEAGQQMELNGLKEFNEGDEIAGAEIYVPVKRPAVFTVRAQLLAATGEDLGTAQTQIHVVPAAGSRVSVDADGFLRVAGQPNFPLGLYNCGRFEEMAAAGFNATHAYGITVGEAEEAVNPRDAELLELLDKCWASGLRMMVELPRKAIEKANWQQVRRRIETFKHHPGLLCWGSEERVARGTAPVRNIDALYALVHELDPDHPLVLGDTRDVIQNLKKDRRSFFPDEAMDIGIWWWYPFPLNEPDGNGLQAEAVSRERLEPPSWLTTTLSRKPLWIALQSYQKPSQGARFPTPAEYRCQAYLSVINQAKGIFFYVGYGQRDYEGKPAGLLNKPEAAHWDYVKALVSELRALSPVIMAPQGGQALEISPAGAPVEYTLREWEGSRYLLAANKSPRAQHVSFRGDLLKGKTAQVLYEQHPVQVQADTLADEFPPLGVHVYRLTSP